MLFAASYVGLQGLEPRLVLFVRPKVSSSGGLGIRSLGSLRFWLLHSRPELLIFPLVLSCTNPPKYEVPTYYTARAETLKGSSDQAPYKLGFRAAIESRGRQRHRTGRRRLAACPRSRPRRSPERRTEEPSSVQRKRL